MAYRPYPVVHEEEEPLQKVQIQADNPGPHHQWSPRGHSFSLGRACWVQESGGIQEGPNINMTWWTREQLCRIGSRIESTPSKMIFCHDKSVMRHNLLAVSKFIYSLRWESWDETLSAYIPTTSTAGIDSTVKVYL